MKLSDINIHLPESSTIVSRVDDYLRWIWGNKELADWLLKAKRYRLWPLIIQLDKLERTCWPETNMEYQLSEGSFNETVRRVQAYIEQWNSMHPLICQFKDNVLSIRDGNHRHEALRRLEIKKYWILVRTDTEKEYNQLIQFLSLHW